MVDWLMGKISSSRKAAKVNLLGLSAERKRLRERVQDLEDLRDLRGAIERDAGKPGIPWNQARKQLGLWPLVPDP